ncbi:MAG: hypothetical protein HYS12_14440 [Planctomycetes bacterium]|nr:hypothetical protein [Planctomycetota bacterium]
MAQYYTLDEAARVLQLTPDEVKKLAEDKKVRTFRDRGTLRFRSQDIDELARSLGLGSEPELQLGEVPPPKKGSSPPPKKAPKSGEEGEVFEYNLSLEDSDQVEIGQLPPAGPGGSKGGPSSSGRKQRSPAPKPGSDSDVRLVPDGSDVDFQVPHEDSATTPKAPAVSTHRPSTVNPGQSKKPGTMPPAGKRPGKISSPDSSVQMVPMEDDSDSDVKMVLEPEDSAALGSGRSKTASDSDIRLEHSKPGEKKGSDDALVTEEIDLDAEVGAPSKPAPSKPAAGKSPPGKAAPGKPAAPQLPKESPFELSETDLDVDPSKPSRAPKRTQHRPADTDSSDDFELTPGKESSSPLELDSDEIAALPSDSDEVSLGEVSPSASDSGINLRDPADSGISLEQEGSDEFELSLDDSTPPKPAPGTMDEESSSEFELSLDDDSSETKAADSSEFELSLDDSGSSELELDMQGAAKPDDSDSEFELTLDESTGSSPLEESGERDIFETDFEVPSLEDESGSEAVALDEDTDLESDSSDFDLALSDEDMVAEDESGSQVVALEDEEEADEAAATVSRRPRGGRGAVVEEEEESPFGEIGPGVEAEEEEEVAGAPGRVRVEYREVPSAPWGPLPVVLLVPCVLVLFVVGLMGFELVQSMLAYQKGNQYTGLVIGPLSEAVGLGKLPGSDTKGGKK